MTGGPCMATAWSITATGAANMYPLSIRKGYWKPGLSLLSAASAIAMTVNMVSQLDGLTHATIDFVSLR